MTESVVVKALRRLLHLGQIIEPGEHIQVSAEAADALVAEGSAEATKKRPKPADPAE